MTGGTGGRSLVGLGGFVMHGDSLLLDGSLSAVDGPAGLFLWRAGRLSKVFFDGELVPGSGRVIDSQPIALGRGGALFLAERLIGAGDTVLGTTITDIGRPAATDGSLIVAAALDPPAPARVALLPVGR